MNNQEFKIESGSVISKEMASAIIKKHGIRYAEDGMADVTEEVRNGDYYEFDDSDVIGITWNHHVGAAMIFVKAEDFRVTLNATVTSELVILDQLLNNTTFIYA